MKFARAQGQQRRTYQIFAVRYRIVIMRCLLAAILVPLAFCSIDSYTDFPTRNLLVGALDSFAWIETTKGVTNVWASTNSTVAPKQLTNFSQVADGLEISALRLLAEHRMVLFASGPIAGANVGSLVHGEPRCWHYLFCAHSARTGR